MGQRLQANSTEVQDVGIRHEAQQMYTDARGTKGEGCEASWPAELRDKCVAVLLCSKKAQ